MSDQLQDEGEFNVVAIGAGAAGLITTAGVAGLGGRAALVEKHKMGGDCLNYGCVPSKALISSARLAQAMREADRWGLPAVGTEVDFARVFESMRGRRGQIEPNDSVERYRSLGVEVVEGEARFLSPHEIEVGERRLRAKHFVITAGSRAGVPPIEGLEDVPYFTNETVFDGMAERPGRLIVIGGGPIGCELSQVMNRFGVSVDLVEVGAQILAREDPEASALVRAKMEAEGVRVRTGVSPLRVGRAGGGVVMELAAGADGGGATRLEADALLVAAGRVPNVEKLNLEAAGVAYNRRGIVADAYLQTSQPHIYAAGDIVGPYQFTHMADYHARVVIRNVMVPFRFLRSKVDYRVVPWATYTDPEVARVGLNETEARQQGVAYDVYQVEMADVDRAIVERADHGFVKVLTAKGTDTIIGVTIVAEGGGELLHEFVLAMKNGIGLARIAATVHAYPTVAEAARKVGDAYNRTRLTPRAAKLFRWLFQRQLRGSGTG